MASPGGRGCVDRVFGAAGLRGVLNYRGVELWAGRALRSLRGFVDSFASVCWYQVPWASGWD